MKSINYSENPTIAVLIKGSYFIDSKLEQYYVKPLADDGITDILALELIYPTSKITVAAARKEISKLLPTLSHQGIAYLYVADATYFKALTGQTKADIHIGYVLPCKIKGFEHIQVILGINYGQLLYNPNLSDKLKLSLQTLITHIQGTYTVRGNIVESAYYPDSSRDITLTLANLHQHPVLACDIETTGLELGSKLFSIAFAYSQHKGVAFKVANLYELKQFFESYRGTLIFHNATFDIKQIIFNCFMADSLDYKGMLHGLHTMYRKVHDTKIIAYLALNSTAGNELSLKDLAHEFTGNYAIDVKDVTAHPVETVLEYNLKDTLATYWVYNQYYPKMLKDKQESIYKTIMLPSLKTLTQIELCGMPINLNQVKLSKEQLKKTALDTLNSIRTHPAVIAALDEIKHNELAKINAKLKTKQHGIDKVSHLEFKPSSASHVCVLLYNILALPILAYTNSKQPAVDSKTLNKLMQYSKAPKVQELIANLISYSQANKILSTFIPAFEKAIQKDNWHYLHGNFNLGGTLSNRLSSSNPNLQNIPSGSIYGKLIKQCFSAPDDWLFVGSDFSSLEDRINALLTKDENKLKVYTDGYDGHSLRAYYYWRDMMPDIQESVASINTIKDKYPQLRQKSKAPTFALTYQGTYHTLMDNCGFSEEEAKQIENNYHQMYAKSDEWIADKLKLCQEQGYLDTAFGLRIRTPIVGKTVLNTSKTPYMAQAEARSVANAVSGQSYCQLTNRAINEFMQRVWASDYRYSILPVCLIHDAIYLMIKNDVEIVKWVNDNLIECMQWQELDEIKHDKVKLEAELDIYYPTWATAITLPNQASTETILNLC